MTHSAILNIIINLQAKKGEEPKTLPLFNLLKQAKLFLKEA